MYDFNDVKNKARESISPLLLQLDYEEITENVDYVLKECGNSGIIMFTENIAIISFDENSNLRIRLRKEKFFTKKDFDIWGEGFNIIGKGPDVVPNSVKMLISDLKSNAVKILIILVIFVVINDPVSQDIELMRWINETLINVVSIFLGMVFVFIGFFYGDKERTIDNYKKGLCYKEFKTDRYVINLAIVSIALLASNYIISYMSSENIPRFLRDMTFFPYIFNYTSKFYICYTLTCIVLIILIIEFDALINYYLKSMRNKYFIDAFEESINNRNNKSK